jgi:hypothetical protein
VEVKRSSLWAGIYLLLVFVGGLLAGGFGHRLYYAKSVDAKSVSGPDAFRQRYLNDMQTRLHLAPEQMQKLVVILDESKARYKAARDRIDPEMKQIQQDQRDKIRQMLNDTQKAEYEKMLAERERRRKESGRGPGC